MIKFANEVICLNNYKHYIVLSLNLNTMSSYSVTYLLDWKLLGSRSMNLVFLDAVASVALIFSALTSPDEEHTIYFDCSPSIRIYDRNMSGPA